MKHRFTTSLLIFEAALFAAYLAALPQTAVAQDVQGIEICTRESRLDRRTGCLQSNVEYLQRVLAKNALAAEQKLAVAAQDITALKDEVAAAKRETAALASQLSELQTRLDRLQKAIPTGQTGTLPPAAPPARTGILSPQASERGSLAGGSYRPRNVQSWFGAASAQFQLCTSAPRSVEP